MGERVIQAQSVYMVAHEMERAPRFVSALGFGTSMKICTFVIEQEEPYESRGSRTVPWERRGETPLRDPTLSHF